MLSRLRSMSYHTAGVLYAVSVGVFVPIISYFGSGDMRAMVALAVFAPVGGYLGWRFGMWVFRGKIREREQEQEGP